jgi:TP901 family phage tail tape measure protein
MAEIIKTVIDVELNSGQFASQLRSLQQQINAFNLTLNKSQLTQGQAAKFFAEELSNAVNSSRFFRAETVKMQTAAAALDSTLRKGQGTLGQFFSAAFNKRSAMAAETFALAAERARTMQTQFIATGKAAKGMQDALAIRPLTAFVSQASIAGQRMQILNSMFKQGTTQLINVGKNVQWAGRQLMVGFTVPLTIFGTTAGKVFMDLEKQVVSFKKVYGDLFTTPAELKQNLEAVQALAAEYTKYGVAVKDTIGLAAQAAAAGRQGAELTDAVTAATRLATLGQMDQNAALDATIALQSAFKLGGEELADTINYLNMVENQTVVSLQDIAAAIPRVAPVIKGLGGDVKDLTVFLAAMQEGGVTAEQGANALKSGLASLINPTKAAKETLSGFGINLQKIVDVNRGDLMGTVTTFADALQKLDEFSRQQALEKVFGKFQYARLGALFENIVKDGSQANQVLETMGYSTEELRMTAEKELNTISQSFGVQLIAAMEKFKLAIAPIGELFVKMAIPIVQFITKLANWFTSLPEGVKNIAAIATVITGVVVPAATMMFGLFMNLVGTLAKMSQGAAIFGATLLKKGPVAAIKTLSQSTKYLSLAEIDAANSARQLGSATGIANLALLEQVGAATSANTAIKQLTNSYQMLIAQQLQAGSTQPLAFAAGANASEIAKTRPRAKIKAIGLNKGNIVPGVGNTDTVPAMLTPGEFVVNKESTKQNYDLLTAINNKQVSGFNKGGKVPGMQYFAEENTQRVVQNQDFIPPSQSNNRRGPDFIRPSRISSNIQNPEQINTLVNQHFRGYIFSSEKAREKAASAIEFLQDKPNDLEAFADEVKRLTRNRVEGKQLNINTTSLNSAMTRFAVDPSSVVKATEKSHINSVMHTLEKDLLVADGRIIPKGTKVQFLNNKVLDFSDEINKKLSKGGATVAEMQAQIAEDVFQTMNFQAERYADELRITGNARQTFMADFLQSKNKVRASYQDILSKLPQNARITDHGLPVDGVGTIKLGDISDTAFSEFGSNTRSKRQLKLFNNILSQNTNVRVAPMQEIANDLYELKGKTGNVNQFAKMGKLELIKETYKAQGIDIEKEPHASFIKSITKISKSTGEEVFDQKQYTSANNFDPNDKSFVKLSERAKNLISKIVFRGSGNIATVVRTAFNKGGQVPGVQYLNGGGRVATGLWEAAMAGITTRRKYDFDKFPIQTLKSGMTAGRRTSGTRPLNVEIYDPITKKTIGQYDVDPNNALEKRSLLNTLQVEKSKGFKEAYIRGIGEGFNKGGMIPGVKYLNGGGPSGKIKSTKNAVEEIFGTDSANALSLFGISLGTRTGSKALGKGKPKDLLDLISSEEKRYMVKIGDQRVASFMKLKKEDGKIKKEVIKNDGGYPVRDYKVWEELNPDDILEIFSEKSAIQNFNRGNIVPGMGNTDTVPAMLTPGEFVVNKEATQKNLGLLHAINAQKLNVGGKVKNGIQYLNDGDVVAQAEAVRDYKTKNPGATTPQAVKALGIQTGSTAKAVRPRGAGTAGAIVGTAAMMPFMGEGSQEQFGGMGSIVASMVAFSAAQKLTIKAFTLITKNAQAGAKGLGIIGKGGAAMQKEFLNTIQFLRKFAKSPITAAIALAVVAVVGFTKLHDNMKQAVSKYNNALYGTSESLENIAKAMGRTTPGQREAQRTSELISGQRATEEEKAMSSQLMNSAEGKSMLQDLQTVKKMGGDQAEALRNQLTQSIMAGVLTPAEARQVATDIGIALKNEKVGIDAVAQITQLVGPEGELIKGNRIEILSQIMAPTNPEDIKEQVDKEMKRIDDAPFWNIFSKSYDFGLAMQQIVKVMVPDDVLASQMSIETLQNNIIQNILKEKEVRAALNEERIKGDITFLEYEKEIAKLNTAGGSLGIKQQLDALNAGDLQFNAAAGAFGSGKNPFRNLGAQLTGAGSMANNAPGFLQDPLGMFYRTEREKKTIAAEDLANRVTKQFDTEMSNMGMDDAQRQDLMKFVTDEFGGNLADQAIFFGDILSGKMNIAAVTFVQGLAKADPEFQKIIDKYGLTETAAAFSPLASSETLMTEASQGLSKKTGEKGAMNLAQVEQLGTNYEKLQALPPEIVKSLELNIESSIDVNKFGPITEDLRRNWDILSALDPQLDKELVFSLIAVDANDNPRTPEQIEKDAIRLNKAMSDLASGTKQEKAKAQLELVALYNGKDISDPAVQENLKQLKKDITGFDDFDAGTQAKLIEIDTQIDAKGLLITALEKIPNRSKDQEEEYQQLLRERTALEKDLASTASSARIAGAGETEKGEESAFQKTKKSFEETKKYQKAIVQLTKQGVSGENIALVDQASLLEMSTSERKKAIDMMKQQQDIQKTLSVMLLSDEEQRIRLQQNAVKIKDKEISDLNRQIEDVERLNRAENQRIDKLQRQNELDNRQTEIRNRALQGLAEKEKTVNSAYDLRAKALDKVAQISDRLAQQQQDRIALAGALTSGDFGAAASAAATMSSNFGANQLQDAKSALETQREKELSSLTAEVNGQLFTRAEIEQQIDDINERVYQRNLSIQSLQDTIFNREQELQPIRDAIFIQEGERLKLARDLEDAEYNKWKTEMDGINASILKWNEYWKAKRGQGGKALKDEYVKASTASKKPKAKSFGGFIRAANGGMINYRGSNEAPPALLANLGMEVPGIGMTDKVPALLTPGEFVVRKSVAQANLPLLKSLNSNVFPESQDLTASPQISAIDNSVSTVSSPVYNNYSVNVNVADTDASANDIASAVMSRIKMVKGRSIRGNRV